MLREEIIQRSQCVALDAEVRRVNHAYRQSSCMGNGDIQTVLSVKKFNVARQNFAAVDKFRLFA